MNYNDQNLNDFFQHFQLDYYNCSYEGTKAFTERHYLYTIYMHIYIYIYIYIYMHQKQKQKIRRSPGTKIYKACLGFIK